MAPHQKDPPPRTPSLPITPMLDMTFQLFAFFVFTYHPLPQEGKFEMKVPGVGGPPAAVAELSTGLVVEVRAVREAPTAGAISQVVVRGRAGDTPVANLEALAPLLAGMLPPPGQLRDIQIAADSGLKYAQVIAVVDRCRKAGFEQVGFGPPPDLVFAGN